LLEVEDGPESIGTEDSVHDPGVEPEGVQIVL